MEEQSSHDVSSGLVVGEERDQSFYSRLPGAFVYPFKGQGWAIIVAGAVFFWVVGLLRFLPFLGLAIGAFVGGYLCAYMIKVVGSSAAGDVDPPDWPDVTNLWDDIVRPSVLVVGAVAFSFIPLIVFLLTRAVDFERPDRAYWVLFGVGLLYLPMGLIAVALFDSLAALNPVLVLVGIVKVAPAYIAALVVLAISLGLRSLVGYVAESVPFLGNILDGMVSLYFLMVEMRILGLLYRVHEKRLGWFV